MIPNFLGYLAGFLHRLSRPQTFTPTCSNCPNWIRQSIMPDPVTGKTAVGVCAKDAPKIYNDYDTGFALKAWTARDMCARHPLYDDRILAGSSLRFRPHDPATTNFGGFHGRVPDFREALRLAAQRQGVTSDQLKAFALPPSPEKESPRFRFEMDVKRDENRIESGNNPGTEKE